MAAQHFLTLSDPAEPTRPRHLAYYEWGDLTNGNVVVCVHGLSRNGRDFDWLARALSARYRVICPDMAGRGDSDWLTNKSGYGYPLYAADCLQLLMHLKLSNVAWVGTSMGGIIGMMLAAAPQSPIKRLVLNDIGAVVSGAGLKRILSYVGTSGSVFAGKDEAMAYLRSILVTFGIKSEEQWQFMLEASFHVLHDGRYALAYDPDITKPLRDAATDAPVTDIDLSAFWNAMQCPVLILRGAESDILARDTALAMSKRPLPTQLVEFHGVGHAPALLDEEQVRVVVDWLG